MPYAHRTKAGTLATRSGDKPSMHAGHSTMSLDRANVKKYGGKMKSYSNELETYVFDFLYIFVSLFICISLFVSARMCVCYAHLCGYTRA